MAHVSKYSYLVSAGVLVFLSLFCLADGGKLLVVPMDGSHWLSMRSVLVALSQKEHKIVVVAPEVNLNVKASEYYTLKTYPVPLTREELAASMHSFANDLFERRPFLQRITALYEKVQVISHLYVSSCTSLLDNKDLMQYLEGSKFDALLTDPVVPCGQILALHLSIPSIFFLRGLPCSFDLQATQCPDPPSYVPRTFTDNSDRMTFIQRVENLFLKSLEYFLCNFAYLPFELLASDVLHRPVTMKELLSHGSIWLKRMDFVFEYPMPVMPNIVFIGGINCGKKKPFSQVNYPRPLMPNMIMVSGVNCAHKKLPQAGLRRFHLGDVDVRSENKINPSDPEGAMVAWQILLKGSRAAKAFLVKTDGAYLVHPPHLPTTHVHC
ncbi:UDP-glucuronosyltransferase 1A1-like [Egretta garzetta]|nr:UDP-glucuronosyltransferase 1A1-like [Egretta garzetta]